MGNFKISNTTTNTPVANMWGATWNIVDDAAAGNNGTSGSTWQLVFQSGSTNAWLRCITNTGAWTDYAKLVTSGNYTNYTVTKTGSGASGSWGISVTGSSGSCTGNAATASEAQIVNSKNSNFDAKQTNNGGTNRYPTAFYINDKNSLLVAYCQASILTSGDVNINLGARNWNTAGTTNVTNALTIGIAKDGTCSYGVSNAAAFRSAIGAGTSSLTIGTTATTAAAGNHTHGWANLTNNADSLTEGSSNWTDNTEILTSYASNNGFADTNAKGKVYKRDAVCCYNYIKSKASGSWAISVTGSSGSCTGNAATATTASACSGNAATASKMGAAASWLYFNNSNEVNFGGTYNSNARIYFGYRATDSRAKPTDYYFGSDEGTASVHCNRLFAVSATDAAGNAANAVALVVGGVQTSAHIEMDSNEIIAKSNGTTKVSLWFNDSAEVTADGKVKNAVWNDYAEYRQTDTIDPGYCVATQEDGIMHITNSRMYPGARIVSDTFGHAIGMSDTAKTPIAVAGRVLVYPYQNRNNYHIGDCVCATYDGKVDIMTREEIKEYPDRIIGIVDEIPSYEYWEQSYTFYKTKEKIKSQIKVNGRIWIYVK